MRWLYVVAEGIAVLSISVSSACPQSLEWPPRGNGQPSFDCTTAKTAAARLICADPELTRLDSALGAVFQREKLKVYPPDQSKFVADELAWIRERNERCSLVGKNDLAIEALVSSKFCMLNAIRERIAFLGGVEQRSLHCIAPQNSNDMKLCRDALGPPANPVTSQASQFAVPPTTQQLNQNGPPVWPAPAQQSPPPDAPSTLETKVRTPKEAADETADNLRNCVSSAMSQDGGVPSVQTAKNKCHVELDGFMQACRHFWLSMGHPADACDLNAVGVISSAVRSDTSSSTQSSSDDLMYCVNPEIQYGQYSSYDGGKSVMTILEGKCKGQYLTFLKSCEQSEDSRTCVLSAATATQLAIKQFGK